MPFYYHGIKSIWPFQLQRAGTRPVGEGARVLDAGAVSSIMPLLPLCVHAIDFYWRFAFVSPVVRFESGALHLDRILQFFLP